MKKIFSLILLCFLGVSSMNLHAYTIDVSKTYFLIQTATTSGKMVGANSANQPAIMDADRINSQQLTFELVNVGVYRIKNGDGNYLAWTSGNTLAYKTSSDLTTSWAIADVGTTGFISLKNVSAGNTYLTTSALTGETPLIVSGTTVPTAAGNNSFKLALVSEILKNNMIDGGFENAVVNSAPLGTWINDASKALGGSGTSRIFNSLPSSGTNSFQLRFLGTQDGAGNSYNRISHLLTGLKKDSVYTLNFGYIQKNWATYAGTFMVYASTVANVAAGVNSTNVNGTVFTSKLATADNVKNTGSISFIAPATSCYIVFSKISNTVNSEYYLDDQVLSTTKTLPSSIIPSADSLSIENTLPATFTVSGFSLSNAITIAASSGFTVSTNRLAANSSSTAITVYFTGLTAATGTITLTSGSITQTITVIGTPTFVPLTTAKYYLTQKSSYNVIGASLGIQPVLLKPNGSTSQKFSFESTGISNTYYLKNDSNQYLNCKGTDKLILESVTKSDSSKWVVVGTTATALRVKNSATGKYLTTEYTDNGSPLIVSGNLSDVNTVFMLSTEILSRRIPPLTPRWAFEHVVWEDMTNTQASTENLVSLYFQHNMPVGATIVDSPWSTSYNNFEWNTVRFPNSTKMIQNFKAKNVKVILWLTGCVNSTANASEVPLTKDPGLDEAIANNFGVNNSAITTWWKGTGIHIDFTKPAAVNWWNARLDKAFVDGVCGLKIDQGEVYFGDTVQTSIGKMSNAAFRPYYYNSMFDYVTSRKPDEGMIIGRPYSYQANQGGFEASVEKLSTGWCGDFSGTFAGLQKQIFNIFTSAEAGYGAPGCEVGGYFEVAPGKEELIRYAQFGSMTACMVNGGSNGGLTNHLPWYHDEETAACYRQAAWLHSQLIPYLFSTVVKGHKNGGSLIKNVSFANESHTLGDYIFTKAITSTAHTVNVTLPQGEWMDFWTKTIYSANTTITQTYPLNKFPLFMKVGSIIPMNISNSYSGIGDSTLTGKQSVYIVPGIGASKFQYFRPTGDGIGYDSIQISYNNDGKTNKITVDGKTSLPYALLIQNCAKPSDVVNADSWKYNNTTHELLVIKTGDSFTINVNVDATNISSIYETIIKMYPNPASKELIIESPETITSAIITSINGKKVLEKRLNSTKNTISLNGLTQGVYFVSITTSSKKKVTKKLVIE
jgi:hypothetical protein